MPIQIRSQSGEILPIRPGQFVEITTDTGEVGMLIYQTDKSIRIVTEATEPQLVEKYQKAFASRGIKFAAVVAPDLDKFHGIPAPPITIGT